MVAIDSLNGYLNSMPHEKFLPIQLNDILQMLGRRGIVSFLITAQHGMLGNSHEDARRCQLHGGQCTFVSLF